MKFAYRDLLQFTIFVILTLHWLSCAFGMSAQLMQAVRTPELKTVVEAAIRARCPLGPIEPPTPQKECARRLSG